MNATPEYLTPELTHIGSYGKRCVRGWLCSVLGQGLARDGTAHPALLRGKGSAGSLAAKGHSWAANEAR